MIDVLGFICVDTEGTERLSPYLYSTMVNGKPCCVMPPTTIGIEVCIHDGTTTKYETVRLPQPYSQESSFAFMCNGRGIDD